MFIKNQFQYIIFCYLFILLCWSCQQSTADQNEISVAVKDYIHSPNPHPFFREADSLLYQRDYVAACSIYQRLMDSASGLETYDRKYFYNQLVYLYIKSYRFEEAEKMLNEVDLKMPDEDEITADQHFNWGAFLLETGKGKEGVAHLKKADDLYSEIYGSQHRKRLEINLLLGKYYYHQITLDSLKFYLTAAESMLEANSALRPFQRDISFWKAQAMLYDKNHHDGLEVVDFAISAAKKEPVDTIFLSRCYALRNQFLRKLDAREDAQRTIESLLALSPTLARYPDVMLDVYEELALQTINDPDTLLFFNILNDMRKSFDRFPNGQQHPDCLLAFYYYKKKKYPASISLYRSLIEQYKSERKNNVLLYDEAYFVLCEMYRSMEQFDSASYFNQLSIQNLVGDRPEIIEAIESRNYQQITPEFRHTLTIFLSKIPAIRFEAYREKPTDPRRIQQSVSEWLAMDSLFFIHSQIKDETSLLEFAEEHFDETYKLAVQACLKAYLELKDPTYLEHAHFFIERVKYAGMARGIMRRQFRQALPDSLAAELLDIETGLKHLHRQKFEQLERENEHLDARIARLNEKQRDLLQEIAALPENLQIDAFDPGIPKLPDLQTLVDRSILQYYITDKTINCLVIRSDTILVQQWPFRSGLDSLAKHYHSLLSNLNNVYRPEKWEEYLQVGQILYEQLLAPVMPLIRNEHAIVICPDVNFPILNFESLPTAFVSSENIDYRAVPYLAKSYNISYTYSLKTFYFNQLERSRILLQNINILAYAFSAEKSIGTSKKWLSRGGKLAPLPGSVKDLAVIKSEFDDQKLKPTLRYGSQANLDNFLLDLSRHFDIIHLSLHAKSDLDNRWNNQIYFPTAIENEVDTLFGPDLESLSFAQSLVVLSACETASGNSLVAEGVYSLARSCFVAGARAVIASQWKVEDGTSAEVISQFYRHLSQGLTPDECLYRARVDYLQNKADAYAAFPGLWAGLTFFY